MEFPHHNFLINFPLREKRLNDMIENGIPYRFKILKVNNKKNLVKLYKSNGKDRSKHLGN